MKTALLIVDVNNLYYVTKKKYNKRINYEKLLNFCKEQYGVSRYIAYGILKGDINKFIEALSWLGFETRFNNNKIQIPESIIDVVKMIPNLDKLVLCSSNKEYRPLVEYLREIGIPVFVLSCGVPKSLKITAWSEITEGLVQDASTETAEPVELSAYSAGDDNGPTRSSSD